MWSTIVDYFLLLSAVIGVGFASGKEIYVFFFSFDGASLFGLVSFALLYVYLFLVLQYISKKLAINSYSEYNAKVFGKFCKITNIILVINFTITASGMLAGADYLFETFFGIKYGIPSLFLSVITFLVVLGGIKHIKVLANVIVPVMIAVIVINSIKNINIENVHLDIVDHNISMAVYYGLLFGVNNFVTALPILFQTRLKTKGKMFAIFTIALIILLNILVLSSTQYTTDMPMFEMSNKLSSSFYIVYFITLILALFSTLVICTNNTKEIFISAKRSKFVVAMLVMVNLIISKVGYPIIVKYLYVVSGAISGIYVICMIIFITIKLIKNSKINRKQKYENIKNNIEEIV